MELHKDKHLFFGCKVDSKMREGLSQATPGARKYFEGDNSEFLRVCTSGKEQWIGKVLKGGISASEIDDIQRNVISILRRISPTIRVAVSSIKIFHICTEDVTTPRKILRDESTGPYIDY